MAGSLSDARFLTHHACQWVSKAARANLEAVPDDSHSNLGWDKGKNALLSHLLGNQYQLGFRFSEPALIWISQGQVENELILSGDSSVVKNWVDNRLSSAGLSETDMAEMPYELDGEPDYAEFTSSVKEAEKLGHWFSIANASLEAVVDYLGDTFDPGPSPVRCWPHHFDIATLISLESGDPETARSIGLGMSPGDTAYEDPYFYCSPWPVPDIKKLPEPPEHFRWHTEGFVSMVLNTNNLVESLDEKQLASMLINGVDIVAEMLAR